MPLRINLEQKSIQVSIREAAEALQSGQRGLGLLGRARAELGSRIHALYRDQRASAIEGFSSEVAVHLHHQVDGYDANLNGRIDGLIDTSKGLLIEEVKSVTLNGAELARARPESFPEYALQARLYGLAAAEQWPDRAIELRLVLVSLLDQSLKLELSLPLEPEATREQLSLVLRRFVVQAELDRQRAGRLTRIAERLRFPYPNPRRYQEEFSGLLEKALADGRPALVMAPTGIGKTAGALTASLRHALSQDAPVLFATAKTTQRQLVARTFSDICRASDLEPGALKCLALRAKEQMCPPGSLLCHPDICPLLRDFHERLDNSNVLDELLSSDGPIEPEAVFAAGEMNRLCPHSLALELVPRVDLIIGDYNHAYGPGVALTSLFGEDARRPALIVVDEAHNLFDRARQYYSPVITRRLLFDLRARLNRGEFLAPGDHAELPDLPGIAGGIDAGALFERLGNLIADLDRYLLDRLRRAEEDELPAIEGCRVVDHQLEIFQAFAAEAEAATIAYALYNRAHGLVHRDDPLVDLLSRVQRLRDVLALDAPEFVPYASGPEGPEGAAVGVLCVNPALRLAASHARARGVVAMSATLTPLSYYSDVLGFSALDPVCACLPSPFPSENLAVRIVPTVSTTYRERDLHLTEIARLISEVVAARPGRYAAYFPSFRLLTAVQTRLSIDPASIMVQLPGMPESARAMTLQKMRDASEATLLLAVMGGVFAEGVDLPGEALIGAVVVGPGLPRVGFERALMQEYFEKEYELGFAYAMLYPGMQRVVQSAGRVIRSPDDRGVVVLLGRRFAEPDLARCLPEHWYRFDVSELLSDDLAKSLKEFWKGHAPDSQGSSDAH